MKKRKDIVDRAADALKHEPVALGPPEETVRGTIAKLSEAAGKAGHQTVATKTNCISLARIAAAAVLLIVAGYAVGRLTARQPDLEKLHAALEGSLKSSLEPAIRQRVLDEMRQSWQLATAAGYVRLKDELSRQFHSQMSEFGAQILAASGELTDQRLTELITAINAAQTHERRWFAAALEQIERNRLEDKEQLADGLASLAVYTGDELARTKQELARCVPSTAADDAMPARQ
jgi:hypothetical protein